ncbi:DUF6886 family protein [Micromonospora sp. NPDC004704]
MRWFIPHVAATAQQPDAYVWGVDHGRAPDYWFRAEVGPPWRR